MDEGSGPSPVIMPTNKAHPNTPVPDGIHVLFIAGFGPVIRDATASRRLYQGTLGIAFEEIEGYLHTERLEGAKTFACWPLEQAAQSCFGVPEWPGHLPVPQAWLEFDVENIEQATKVLEAQGYTLLVRTRTEPWGQTVSRLQSPEGLLVGVTYTPSMRKSRKRR